VFLYREPAAGGGFSVLRDGIANDNRFALNTEEDLEKGDKLQLRMVTTTAGQPLGIETWTVSALNKDTGHLATGAGTSEMADDKARFLVPEYREATLDMSGSGDYTSGRIKIIRIGDSITISGLETLDHSSTGNASSASGLIPSWAIPLESYRSLYNKSADVAAIMFVNTDGTLQTIYRNSAGSAVSRTDSMNIPWGTYNLEN
jgi:hypothetical protein